MGTKEIPPQKEANLFLAYIIEFIIRSSLQMTAQIGFLAI